MQLDPALRPRQPLLHQFRVAIPSIVEKHVDQPQPRIHCLDCRPQHDRADGIHRRHLQHGGLAGLQVDRTVDVEALPVAALRHRDRNLLRRPAARRPHCVRRMHRIGEHHRLISLQTVQHLLVFLDVSSLFLRVELARHLLRLVILRVGTVQQRDQPGPGQVRDAEVLLDPGSNFAGRARQRCDDPCLQLRLLRIAQAAGAAFVAEACQPPDDLFLVEAIPDADGVVVQQENLGERRKAYPVVEQHRRVGTPGQPMPHQPAASQFDQILPRFRLQETSTDHATR